MDIKQLEAFSAVMSTGSLTAAGQLLGRSQPAMSRLIHELEQSVGFALFERYGPKVTPTSRAFQLHAQTESALAGFQEARRYAENLKRDEHDEHEQIRIACTPALGIGLVPQALAQLDPATRPSYVSVQSQSAEQVLKSVLGNGADLGVVSLPLEHRGVNVHWIGEAPCQAVIPADSPLAAQARIDAAQLADATLITLSNPYRLRRRIDAVIGREQSAGRPLYETNSSFNAVNMARVGLGVALVDPFSVLGIPLAGVVARPVTPNIPFFFGVISPYARTLSDTARALLQGLETVASQLVDGFVRHEAKAHDSLLQSIYATPHEDEAR
ncbi:MAG: Octopine catabolism/uptake operon regulatory protein OccR [Pseudomonas citronellolis]|nr:MAG: Octopine catabolism/uptake operon regulatory protein OccR [Pseudomonas citronellolis]